MPDVEVMMANTQEVLNLTGRAIQADGWHGHVNGLHTVVVQVVNFTGRISIEASLELSPSEADWFTVDLDGRPYLEFPQNKFHPTGAYPTGGDTDTLGVTFKINALWLRARLDRSYLVPRIYSNDRTTVPLLGNVVKITLAR
jgi:hypothetical protein